jgi:hypothetical protein
MTIPRLAARTLLVALLSFASAKSARADMSPDDAVDKVTQLNKDAVTAYQAKKFEDARKILKQALDVAASSGIETHPITARTHIHLGIVIIGGFKQRDLGVKQFKKALELQPDINLTKSLVTPELADAFAEAKSGGSGGGSGGTGEAKPATPPAAPPTEETPPAEPTTPPANEATTPLPNAPEEPSNGLAHEPVSEAQQGSAISVTVGIENDLQFDKIILAYRPEGATDFLGREMKQVSEGRYGAEIPPTATSGGTVAYYIEAEDKDGAAVASRGSIDNPIVIHLMGVGARHGTHHEESEEEDEGPDYRFYVGLLAGSGIGWATGSGDSNTNVNISPAGFAQAGPAEISPEVGYWWSSSLMLSLQLRYQYITGTTDLVVNNHTYHAANYAFAAFAKATWRFGEGKLHPFVSLAVGGGRIRHVVSFANQHLNDCGSKGNQTCVDTIGAGPVLAGPGGGISYDLGERFALVLQANSVLGFPNFTVNVDGNVGVAFVF